MAFPNKVLKFAHLGLALSVQLKLALVGEASWPVPEASFSGSRRFLQQRDEPACADFTSWPAIDRGVTCGGCTALVLTYEYMGRCDKYCESFGHICLAAAEEVDETCNVERTSPCHEEIAMTSDMLCTCAFAPSIPDASTHPPIPDAGLDWGHGGSTQPPIPDASTHPPIPDAGLHWDPAHQIACADFARWPSLDNGVTCSGCTALVLTAEYGGRCDRYCESFGHRCVEAAEEVDETCAVKYSSPCSVAISGTSDMLCTCAL